MENKKDYEIISPITLKMPRKLWDFFKDCTPRRRKLNDAVVELIQDFVMKESEPATQEEYEEYLKSIRK